LLVFIRLSNPIYISYSICFFKEKERKRSEEEKVMLFDSLDRRISFSCKFLMYLFVDSSFSRFGISSSYDLLDFVTFRFCISVHCPKN
jgi:hypothetical protein